MSYTEWLRRNVARLETEIRSHPIFDSDEPATRADLAELRAKVVLHTFLRQQLRHRESVRERITQEFALVPVLREVE